MQAIDHNGMKVYDMCVGKTLPQWLSEKQKRSLRKDEEHLKRIELLQDFHFNTYSSNIKVSEDGNHIVATGGYPPQVKVYDTRELAMKFERHVDATTVQFEILADDYSKLVFLNSERYLEFHAAYGSHYKLRIPTFGRDTSYDRSSCELFVAASSKEVYRLDLEQGTFMAPYTTCHENGVNKLSYAQNLQLLACGGADDVVSCWDGRERKQVGTVNIKADEVTSLRFDNSGIMLLVGGSNGEVSLFDIRSSKPLHTHEHPSGFAVVGVDFQRNGRAVVSADRKSIRFWNRDDGDSLVNVDPQHDVSDICWVHLGSDSTSGLFFAPGETDRIMTFYVPQLGHAPKWASFLDNLTEELEEKKMTGQNVYDNYKFVTRKDLESLGITHLLGTPLLRAYMHGYFMDMKFYEKVKSVADPVSFKDWRKEKIKQKIEAKTAQRIVKKTPAKSIPKVNSAFAERMEEDTKAEITSDKRFSAMFDDPDFQIDEDSEQFRQVYSSGMKTSDSSKKPRKKLVMKEADDTPEDVSIVASEQKKRKKTSTTIQEKLEKKSKENQVKYLKAGNMELSFTPKK